MDHILAVSVTPPYYPNITTKIKGREHIPVMEMYTSKQEHLSYS